MNIRHANATDRPQLLGFIAASQDAECAVHDSRLPGQQIAEQYYQNLLDNNAVILIVEVADQAIGFVAGRLKIDDDELQKPEWRHCGLISDIYVAPDFRQQGIAKRLLQAMSDRLQQDGATRLRICAVATNRAAIKTYQAFGFQGFEIDFDKPLTPNPPTAHTSPPFAP